ncbi:unnamed protein product [Blepharisma stoltei]|uniref:Uncharacterized protein n=1 Tax=Blepharisma stoltei TaxID=1481888 RepID=A0AAU9K9Y2_9CILI|nr:unnamed protein product [Blepharisma stoltei]
MWGSIFLPNAFRKVNWFIRTIKSNIAWSLSKYFQVINFRGSAISSYRVYHGNNKYRSYFFATLQERHQNRDYIYEKYNFWLADIFV